jgi:hypothetical protein
MAKYMLFYVLLLSSRLFGQNTVDVVENTLKVTGLGEETFYYGFAEGDQLIFNFEELNGKELKEIEITELPTTSRFMDYKTTNIQNKVINIAKTGIYKFRFANSAIGGRVCKFKIQRIPHSDGLKNFNTMVYWHTVYDTTFIPQEERYLVRTDTNISNFINTVVKVHSKTNDAGNTTTFNFLLPENTVVWSYYIGVDQAGLKAFEKATGDFTRAASQLVSKIPEYGPLAALALNGFDYFTQLQHGEAVNYCIVDENNIGLFRSGQAFKSYKYNRVINDRAKMTLPLRGMHYFCFSNDNMVTGVDVYVRAVAVVVTNKWDTRPVKKIKVSSREEAYLKP